jgi:hypothetical protein
VKKSKPMINVSHNVMTRRSYTLTDAAAKIIEEYARFLSDHENFRVSPGEIISQLVLKLCKDEMFMNWQRQVAKPVDQSGQVRSTKPEKIDDKKGDEAHV